MVATYSTFDELAAKAAIRCGPMSRATCRGRSHSPSAAGWANVVVGNPPWVAFRHMSADLQKRFRELAKGERVYIGGRFATQNDSPLCSPCAPSLCIPVRAGASPSCCRSRR